MAQTFNQLHFLVKLQKEFEKLCTSALTNINELLLIDMTLENEKKSVKMSLLFFCTVADETHLIYTVWQYCNIVSKDTWHITSHCEIC